MQIGEQIKAIIQSIYENARAQLKMGNVDPIMGEIIMECVISKFRDDAFTVSVLGRLANSTPPKTDKAQDDMNKENAQNE